MTVTLSEKWSTVRFARANEAPGGWALSRIPQGKVEALFTRLFVLEARFISSGCLIEDRSVWVVFKATAALASRFALVFPAPAGCEPLLVSKKGSVLSGKAEEASRKAGPKDSIRVQATA